MTSPIGKPMNRFAGWLRHPQMNRGWTTRKSKECYKIIKLCSVLSQASEWILCIETHNSTQLPDTMFVVWVFADCPEDVLMDFDRRLARNFDMVGLTFPTTV
jgi:hypothetical protein